MGHSTVPANVLVKVQNLIFVIHTILSFVIPSYIIIVLYVNSKKKICYFSILCTTKCNYYKKYTTLKCIYPPIKRVQKRKTLV